MRYRLGKYIVTTVAALAVIGTLSASAHAQIPTAPGPKNTKKAGPTPRSADGHPDLSGIWWPGNGNPDLFAPGYLRRFDPKETPQEAPSFQPWALEKIKAAGNAEVEDPRLCRPVGVPGFMNSPYPYQIVQTPGQVVLLAEHQTTFRVIPADGRPHTKDPDPLINGDSVGRWQGDTFVIDVISFDEKTPVFWSQPIKDKGYWFHSDALHVIERFRRPDSETLIYQVTVEDPKVLTKPWTSAPQKFTRSDYPLNEYYCTNEQDGKELRKLDQ
jgi:hypothetical protein